MHRDTIIGRTYSEHQLKYATVLDVLTRSIKLCTEQQLLDVCSEHQSMRGATIIFTRSIKVCTKQPLLGVFARSIKVCLEQPLLSHHYFYSKHLSMHGATIIGCICSEQPARSIKVYTTEQPSIDEYTSMHGTTKI